MPKRLLKQIIIAFIFFSLVGGLSFWLFLSLRPDPTCFDGIKNQDETEIDCGGVCEPCELVYAQDIETLWTKAIPTQDNHYDLVALIKNPNPNYGSGNIPYSFKLYDNIGQLIDSYPGETYLLPHQEKYLTKLKVLSPIKVSEIKIKFGEITWKKPLKEKTTGLYVKEKEYRVLSEEETGYSRASAILVNDTDYGFDKVSIDVFLFNSIGDLAAVNNYQVESFFSGQKRDFITNWFYPIRDKISRVEMQVETNLFNQENFIDFQPEPEKFQEY